MVRANEAVGFQVPDARTRVTRLLDSIQTSYNPLQNFKGIIENDTSKRNDFEQAVDFMCKFQPPRKPSGSSGLHRISSTFTEMKSDLDQLKNVKVDIRFYTPDEWRNLSPEQRRKCMLTRRLQNQGNGDNGKRKASFDKQTKRWQRKIEKKNQIIASLKAENNDNNSTNEKSENKDEPKVKFNKGVAQRSK